MFKIAEACFGFCCFFCEESFVVRVGIFDDVSEEASVWFWQVGRSFPGQSFDSRKISHANVLFV
jgi:hypothetical protein